MEWDVINSGLYFIVSIINGESYYHFSPLGFARVSHCFFFRCTPLSNSSESDIDVFSFRMHHILPSLSEIVVFINLFVRRFIRVSQRCDHMIIAFPCHASRMFMACVFILQHEDKMRKDISCEHHHYIYIAITMAMAPADKRNLTNWN